MKKNKFPPGEKIGIAGAGQLGYMLIEVGLKYGIRFATLDAEDAPAARISDEHIVGSLYNENDLKKLSEVCDVMTYEIENVDAEILENFFQNEKKIIPFPSVLKIIQDKSLQKEFYVQHNIPTAKYFKVKNNEEKNEAAGAFEGHKKITLKACKGGYDGKGVQILTYNEFILTENFLWKEYIVEEFIECEKEISVIVAVSQSGDVQVFPSTEMVFDPVLNLVDTLICPAEISVEKEKEAKNIATQVAKAFNSAGLFAVEMFLTKAGKIYVNETAPRPHNSGHHSIEACSVSQYEMLLRILCNFPLIQPILHQHAAMLNIIGPNTMNGKYNMPEIEKLLSINGLYLHLYGKTETRPGRKLGHVTILAKDKKLLQKKIAEARKYISIVDSM